MSLDFKAGVEARDMHFGGSSTEMHIKSSPRMRWSRECVKIESRRGPVLKIGAVWLSGIDKRGVNKGNRTKVINEVSGKPEDHRV